MNEDFTALYVFTIGMLIAIILFICLIVKINKFKISSQKRDEYYMQRIEGLEAIVRTEVLDVVSQIKKMFEDRDK